MGAAAGWVRRPPARSRRGAGAEPGRWPGEDGGGPAYLAEDVTPDGPSVESEVLAALRGASLDETTPLQALQLLARLQKQLVDPEQ